MNRRLKIAFITIVVLFLLVELAGRYYGFHSYPLYISSDDFEYIYAPNQKLKIFKNSFYTNEYSMRSKPIDNERDTTVVLLIGDSIINGGNWTDNDSLGTTILEKKLSQAMRRPVRALNVSAGSWGPDNAAAYIRQYGTFNANLVVLVVSSHDAYDTMTKANVVGDHPQYPEKNYFFAWNRLLEKGWQQITERVSSTNNPTKINRDLSIAKGNDFNPGFSYFDSLTRDKDIPLLIYIHPTVQEVEKRSFNGSGREIIRFCDSNSIKCIKELDNGINLTHYRDGIHYNSKGQKLLATNLYPLVLQELMCQQQALK